MRIIRNNIYSSPALDDPRPWFEFQGDASGVQVRTASVDGVAIESAEGATAPADELRRVALAAGEPAVWLVTIEGAAVIVPWSEQPVICTAHLGFYYPETDELHLLRFVDDTPPEVAAEG